MKKLFFLLSFSILLQGCFSYKAIDYNSIKIEKKQKFEVLKLDRANIKGRLVSKNEKTMVLENKGQLQTIVKGEIYEVKVKKFSLLKSTGLVVGSVLVVPFLLYALLW
ncbi:MAG: hypothetical protein ACI9EK_002571 [Psychroserpens sp.]|jgi:hypothetical protein